MDFDPFNANDYHRYESTSVNSTNSRKKPGSNGNGTHLNWQEILGLVILVVAVVALVCGTIANMPK